MGYVIKAMFWDLGRVLANFNHTGICEGLAKFSNLGSSEIYRIIFQEGLEKTYDSGLVDSFAFYSAAKEKINASSELDFTTFVGIWNNEFTQNNEIEETLASIRPEIRKFLLSNTNELHWEQIKKLPIIETFFPDPNFLIRSYMVRMRKPEIGIYWLAIGKAGCPSSEIIYIDDIEENVNVFRSLGGHGILYDCTKNSLIDLLKKLKPFGVFI